MDFEHAKSPSFVDSMDTSSFTYMDNGLEYLPYSQSPSYDSIALPTADNFSLIGGYTYDTSSLIRPYTPPDGASISGQTLAYISGGELSSDSGRRSGTHSPPATIPYAATVPRSHRFTPLASPATRASVRAHRRKPSRSNDDSDEDDDDFQPNTAPTGSADSRRETIRKQRIESEQRRRDELRDGYARLKETLPASNQKSSKVSLLDRATGHLRYLETVKEQLEMRLKAAEAEVHRLRNVNEALMLSTARHTVGASALAASAF
jgi:hypothetical protein